MQRYHDMELSIIIVNWNSKVYLQRCIASILENTTGIEYEIVVIDNGSFDGCGEMLLKYYPKIKFIQSDSNLGFARANNEAFKVSVGSNILFLNPDIEIEAKSINIMLAQLRTIANAGIVGAKLLNSDRTIQTSCIQSFPCILNQILDSEELRKRYPRSRLWGAAPLFDGRTVPVGVDAVSGACLMIRRSVFENVDRFSMEYFMYSEDIDLCYKVIKSRWKIYYVPGTTIIHHGGGSSSRSNVSSFSNVMMMESQWQLFRKTHSKKYSGVYRFVMFIAAGVRIGMILFISPFIILQKKSSAIKTSTKKWIAILRWTVGLERWVKDVSKK